MPFHHDFLEMSHHRANTKYDKKKKRFYSQGIYIKTYNSIDVTVPRYIYQVNPE